MSQASQDWQVRSMVGASFHLKVGAAANLFEFKKDGKETYQFLFVGGGLGVGVGAGLSDVNFPPPHTFLWDTAKLVGGSFYSTAQALLGYKMDDVPQVSWSDDIEGWTRINCTESFTADDLHLCTGRYTQAFASVAIGYSSAFISATAVRAQKTYFSSHALSKTDTPLGEAEFGGKAGGVGAGLHTNGGLWIWTG